MLLDILWNGETTPVDLNDGAVTVGGGPKDDIQLAGLPFKLLTLTVEGPRLSIKAIRPLRIGNQLFPAHVPRLVMPGESMKLPNDVEVRRPEDEQSRERRKNKSTDFLAKELLADGVPELEMRAATFTCVAGADEGHVFPIAFLETSIGRADDADLRLRDRTVSRQHAKLIHRRSTYFVEDLATTNGIYVNGKRVKNAQRIVTGDIVELGHTVLRFDEGERAPEERTVIEKVPQPPPSPESEPNVQVDPSLTAPPPPSSAVAAPHSALENEASHAVTAPLPPRRRLRPADLAFLIVGALLFCTGLATAVVFAR